MVKRLFAVFVALTIVFGNAGAFYALDIAAPKHMPVSVTPSSETVTLIVETKDTGAAKKAVLSLDSDAVIMGDYDILLSGFAVTLSAKAAKAVASIKGVTGVWQSLSRMTGSVEERAAADADLAAALNPGYKYRGEGMVAAIIDTSFDVYHEMFTLSDPKSGRITKDDITTAIDGDLTVTNYFTHGGGEGGASPYVNAKIPYAFDYSSFDTDVGDGDSHGTHVAGIVAANNCGGHALGFDGIAPEAQLLLMKAGQDNSKSLDDYAILYAIEDAITLGADVINMSFSSPAGSSKQEYGSFNYGKVMKSAEEHGVVLISSAGNENMLGKSSNYDNTYGIDLPLAANPDYGLVGSPSTFPTALSVASIDSNYNITNTYIENASGVCFVYSKPDIAVDLTVFGEKLIEYAAVPGAGSEQDYKGLDISGKVALIMRGTISFNEKIKNAAAAGAVAAVIYNNSPDENELVTMDLDESVCSIPAVFIYYRDGRTMAVDSQMKIKFISGHKTAFSSPSGGMMSSFSSRGLTSDMSLKPEITAPGGNIYSSVPSGYGVQSGTSMSAPYMAGAALLVRQMLAETGGDPHDTVMVRRILMATAVPVVDVATGVEYSPRTQGAGLVDIKAALDCTATLYGKTSLAKVELGDIGRVFSFEFNVENGTGRDITYNVTASTAGDEYKYIVLDPADRVYGGEYFITGRTAAFKRAVIKIDGGSGADINKYKSTKSDTVTVPANSNITVKMNVEIDSGTYTRYKNIFKNGFFAEGFVRLTPDGGGQTLSLPYVGYCGDWSDPPVFDGKVNSKEDCFYTQYAFSYALVDGKNYMYNLGCSLFLEADRVNSSVIAISPDGDGSGDYIALALTPLRNIADMSVTIKSEDGEVVLDESGLGHAVKSYYDAGTGDVNNVMLHYLWDGTDIKNAFYSMPDGKYRLSVYTETESGRSIGEWSMSFTVDTVDPTLDEVYLTHGENGELYLNVTISDNGYLQYAVPYTTDGNLSESYKPAAKDAVSKTSRCFDITDAADREYIYFDIADYALNIKTLRLMLDELEVRK